MQRELRVQFPNWMYETVRYEAYRLDTGEWETRITVGGVYVETALIPHTEMCAICEQNGLAAPIG